MARFIINYRSFFTHNSRMLKSTLRWESIAHHGLLLPVSTGIHQRKDSEQVHLCCLKNVSKPISDYSLSPYISLCGKEGHTLRVNRIHAAMEVVGSVIE